MASQVASTASDSRAASDRERTSTNGKNDLRLTPIAYPRRRDLRTRWPRDTVAAPSFRDIPPIKTFKPPVIDKVDGRYARIVPPVDTGTRTRSRTRDGRVVSTRPFSRFESRRNKSAVFQKSSVDDTRSRAPDSKCLCTYYLPTYNLRSPSVI